ncbi:MAG: hypothetical protein M1816_002516 [Peltula sp. TS41687]|nr:MAG: hypothetical protein M1816_002516 [Peltula sp. TS41687]
MSLLSVVHLVEPCTELVDVIRKQINGGRLKSYKDIPFTRVNKPTPELSRLVSIFEAEVQAKFEFMSLVNFGVKGVTVLPIYSTCYVFCIEKRDEGGTAWFDCVRRVEVDGMTLLKCNDGRLKTMGNGGTYLLLSVDNADHGWSADYHRLYQRYL